MDGETVGTVAVQWRSDDRSMMGAWMAEIERVASVVGRCWIQLERMGRPKVGAWQLFAQEIYPAVVWTVGSQLQRPKI
ncbi:hypothetical protein V6N12_068565 [Hibiscus sabdariffa]|uniref:Uncharacterized protein n=1 Tax=Hibiscus sabdariffa TaxID=183260 RepID=A0ABR2FQA8_9ROSI